MQTYDRYARNKPVKTIFDWEYRIKEGKVLTSFEIQSKNLQTQGYGGETLMSFLPHHWRKSTTNFEYIQGALYRVHLGQMKTGAGTKFILSYAFGGLPPYLPKPLGLNGEQQNRLNDIVSKKARYSDGQEGNTYAKGFGEKSNIMLMAKELGLQEFEIVRDNLKKQLQDWFTYDPATETDGRFFVKYPEYGAVIGFPCGYGSQGFNDLHFHNGYFTVGAARLMSVDKDFKTNFAEMAKLITKTYVNWNHYEEGDSVFQPFFRTFDPYCGHSWAGGTGDDGGNNQESSSEAIHSWFGVFSLGVELNDERLTALGATGFLLETEATAEYWLDEYHENFAEEYKWKYVGILGSGSFAWATYFDGDAAWVLGIQAVPCDFFYHHMGNLPASIESTWKAMLADRVEQGTIGTTDPKENIQQMGAYLGGYHLNILNTFNPRLAAQIGDELYSNPGGEWADHINAAHNYYISNAIVSYGRPAIGYHTSIASGAVYQNSEGVLTYLLYNPTDALVNVEIYRGDNVIDTIAVQPGQYYRSRN